MKSISAFAVLFLEAAIVSGLDMKGYIKNTPDNGMVEPAPVVTPATPEPQSVGVATNSTGRGKPKPLDSCLFSIDPLSIISPSDPRFSWDDYCYAALLAPPTTVTKTVQVTQYATATVSPTVTVKQAVTSTLIGVTAGTVTQLCPIPTAASSSDCGVKGWGIATNNIDSVTGLDGNSCHQLCLETANCASFQTGVTDTSPICNLYSTDASANNTITGDTSPFTFYDRDCQNLAPGCSGVVNRGIEARTPDTSDNSAYGPPVWFLSLPIVEQYQICECIEGATYPIPGTTYTLLSTKTVAATNVITKPVTAYVTTTATVGGGTGFATVYTSVH